MIHSINHHIQEDDKMNFIDHLDCEPPFVNVRVGAVNIFFSIRNKARLVEMLSACSEALYLMNQYEKRKVK